MKLAGHRFKKGECPKITLKNAIYSEVCHKTKWIDDVVNARDSLVHPAKGLLQVMFQLEIKPKGKEMTLVSIKKPSIGDLDFDQYAEKTFNHMSDFSKSFITVLKAHNKAALSTY